MIKEFRPRLNEYEVAMMINDIESNDYAYPKEGVFGVMRKKLRLRLMDMVYNHFNISEKERSKKLIEEQWEKDFPNSKK